MSDQNALNSKTINDLYRIMSDSLELQKQTLASLPAALELQQQNLACLEEVKAVQQQQLQQSKNSANSKLNDFKKELLQLILARPQKTNGSSRSQNETTATRGESSSRTSNCPVPARTNTLTRSPMVKTKPKQANSPQQRQTPQKRQSSVKGSTLIGLTSIVHKRVYVHCQDDHLRDIKKPGGHLTSFQNIPRLITELLKDFARKKKKKINVSPTVVQPLYDSVKAIARRMLYHMLTYIAKLNNTSVSVALERTHWSNITPEIQDRYSFFLERRVFEECGLGIARCKNMWGSRLLMQSATTLAHRAQTINSHMDVCDGLCEIDDQDLANMNGVPLSLLANHGEGSDVKVVKKEESEEEETEESQYEEEESDSDDEYIDSKKDMKEQHPVVIISERRKPSVKEKEPIHTIKRSTATKKVPMVIPVNEDDDDDDNYDNGDTFDFPDIPSASSSSFNTYRKRANSDSSENQQLNKKQKGEKLRVTFQL